MKPGLIPALVGTLGLVSTLGLGVTIGWLDGTKSQKQKDVAALAAYLQKPISAIGFAVCGANVGVVVTRASGESEWYPPARAAELAAAIKDLPEDAVHMVSSGGSLCGTGGPAI